MPYQIMSAGTNTHCRDESVSETKAEWGLKCFFSTPRFLTRRVWIVKKSSLLPPLPPPLTSLAWFGCCISFQLYNLETWGLFQGNHRNLRCFNLIRSLRKKAKHSGESLVLLILDLLGDLRGGGNGLRNVYSLYSGPPMQSHIKY